MTSSAWTDERLLRELAPEVLRSIVRRYRDFSAAEDAVQEALLAATQKWPKEGLPDSPRAWLIQVASRRMVDHVRAEAARRHREQLVVSLIPLDEQIGLYAESDDRAADQDDSLKLLFLCCHPALSKTSAIALTLRAVGGLTTSEIARAFLVPEPTMAQRISRAKEVLRSSAEPPGSLTREEFKRRLGAVSHVLYLVFSEGYAASGSALLRTDLSAEAIRLTRLLQQLVPDDAEVLGLLSLMLLTDARRAARTGPAGELIPLDEQDRSLWDAQAIAEGIALVSRALGRGSVGPYQLQAAVAALHDEAKTTEETDWPQILALYRLLDQMEESPMVKLNLAVATAMVEGPAAGLACLDRLESDPRLHESHRLDSVRGHLLERLGEVGRAADAFRRAAGRTASIAERDYLLLRAARLAEMRARPDTDR